MPVIQVSMLVGRSKEQKAKIAQGNLAPEVKDMYDSAMKLSPRFAKDFTSFWGIKANFRFAGGK